MLNRNPPSHRDAIEKSAWKAKKILESEGERAGEAVPGIRLRAQRPSLALVLVPAGQQHSTHLFLRTDLLPLRKGTQYSPNYRKDLKGNRNYKQLPKGPICKVHFFPAFSIRLAAPPSPPPLPTKESPATNAEDGQLMLKPQDPAAADPARPLVGR